jgi:hypothetical protein
MKDERKLGARRILSEYYFINEQGKLCCILEGTLLEVIGSMEYESGRCTFKHKNIEVRE